jgi:hypothetical protein
MLDPKAKLGHLAQVLEVLRHSDTTLAIADGEQKILEDPILKVSITLIAEVAGGLMKILRGPEGSVSNINIQCQTSSRSTNRWLWLSWC